MSRFYRVVDERGERRIEAFDFPLAVGGRAAGAIVLPDCADDAVVAHIALSEGHAYIQPSSGAVLFHNGEHLRESTWLKSGDQVQFEDSILHWTVRGDQVQLSVRQLTDHHPPAAAAPAAPELRPAAPRRPLPVVEAPPPPAAHRTLKRTVTGVFIVLLALAGFLLLSTPVGIRVSPDPERVSLRGFPPPLTLGGRYLAWPGRYRLQAQREGYYDLDETLAVARHGNSEFEYTLRELPGLVRLKVTPDVPYELRVDDQVVAVESSIAHIGRGVRTLSIHAPRYLVAEQPLDVEGFGHPQAIDFALQPAWASIAIDSQPPGAQVLVDDQLAGITPLSADLLQGERSIVLEKALYKPARFTYSVIAGKADSLATVVLQPADGRLTLESTPAAVTLEIDGQYQGVTPAIVALSPGETHELRASKPGYALLQKRVSLAPGEEQTLTLTLQPEYGTVFVNADPIDAGIRVDGRELGKATGRLRLTTDSHRIEIFKPGYETHVTTLTPRAGSSQTLNITLKTQAQAKTPETPQEIRAPAGQRLRLVRPRGVFETGASRREAGRRANENQRRVELIRPFYFGAKEVTNAQYRQFRPAHTSGSAEGVALDGDDQPVVNLSWDDAARYCNWLSEQEGLPAAYREQGGKMQLVQPPTRGYRLPTEIEWVYVARALSHNPPARYPWSGEYPPVAVTGNYADARISDTLADALPDYDDGWRGSAPVGSFAAFPDGFHDLGGNVSEWVNDYYTVYPGVGDTLVKDPLGPLTGEHHAVRGSSWRHGNITELRLSYRDYSRKARDDLGFRLARYAE